MAGKKLVSMKSLEKKFLGDVEDATARINQPQGNTIGIRNSKFTYKQEVIGRSLVAIAIDFVHAQTYYDTAFDPDNPAPPACHALSVDGEDMQPLDASPSKQADYCDGCEMNAWGSANVGRGKACGQQYKIALIAAGPNETLGTCEMAVLTLPPTSLKNWDTYVKALAKDHKRPPYAVYTRFGFAEDEEWPILEFEVDRLVDDVGEANEIIGRQEEARKLLLTPPDFSQREATTKKKVSKKKKKVAKKKKVTKKKAKKKTTTRKKRGASKFS